MSSNRLLQLQGIWPDIFAVQLGSSFVCRSFHVLVCCFWSSQLGPEVYQANLSVMPCDGLDLTLLGP